MSLRVCVLTEDPAGPSARHRWGWPAASLREHGIEVTLRAVEPRAARGEAFREAAGADVVVIHRKLFRLPDFQRLRKQAGDRLAFDVDDAVMFRPTGRRRQWSFFRGLRFSRTLRQSLLFIAGNRYLADRAPRLVPTIVRPTPIELSRYEPRREWPERGRVVGWIGTAATLPYLREAAPALTDLAARRGDLVLRVIGPEPEEIPGVEVMHVPWSEETEASALRSLDAGILPLPDDCWTRGKCAFKALQYMAAGLPVVASPVGMNREVVEDGVTGCLASGRREWTDSLARLLDDSALRESQGRAGRERVAERYSNEVLSPKLARSLVSVFG